MYFTPSKFEIVSPFYYEPSHFVNHIKNEVIFILNPYISNTWIIDTK